MDGKFKFERRYLDGASMMSMLTLYNSFEYFISAITNSTWDAWVPSEDHVYLSPVSNGN
jgi:hypothetical protein